MCRVFCAFNGLPMCRCVSLAWLLSCLLIHPSVVFGACLCVSFWRSLFRGLPMCRFLRSPGCCPVCLSAHFSVVSGACLCVGFLRSLFRGLPMCRFFALAWLLSCLLIRPFQCSFWGLPMCRFFALAFQGLAYV